MIVAKTLLVKVELGNRGNIKRNIEIGNQLVKGGMLRKEEAAKNFCKNE